MLPHIKRREGGHHGATILGAHVEGPFISPQKKGAHSVDYMKSLDKVYVHINIFVLHVWSCLKFAYTLQKLNTTV